MQKKEKLDITKHFEVTEIEKLPLVIKLMEEIVTIELESGVEEVVPMVESTFHQTHSHSIRVFHKPISTIFYE